MRLIDTATLELYEFFGDSIPHYAILSHTWIDNEEVLFQDWVNRNSISNKLGYKKIVKTCQLAKQQGFDYVWVDTVCIDKTSSSELSEAINSMFRWYQKAKICYVYLIDVSEDMRLTGNWDPFRKSRWFKRGWTLQELLAPPKIEFYNSSWTFLGTKMSLYIEISNVTDIDAKYIWQGHGPISDNNYGLLTINYYAMPIDINYHAVPLGQASIAERFSWLSSRRTTRTEDMAYCMLGIFDLNMPLLYGEGIRAFTRLQQEIMKSSDDHSLFCWTSTPFRDRGSFFSTLPSGFARSRHFLPIQEAQPSPYSLTNVGLSITLPVLHCWFDSDFIVVLKAGLTPNLLGLRLSGNLETGRMYRTAYPAEPIPLSFGVSICQQFRMFISENHSQQFKRLRPTFKMRDPVGHSALTNKQIAKLPQMALLTFEPRDLVVDIRTYPPGMFKKRQGYLTIRSADIFPNRLNKNILFDTPIGVLVQMKLKTGDTSSFIVSTRPCLNTWDREMKWKWHHWHVSPGDAAIILANKYGAKSRRTWQRARNAIWDPGYAQSIDFQNDPLGFRVSMAWDYVQNHNGVIRHIHLSWPLIRRDPLLKVCSLLASVAAHLFLFAELLVQVAYHAAKTLTAVRSQQIPPFFELP